MFIFLYIFFYIFTYVYVYLHIFCVFLYIFVIFSYKIDSLINGGRRRRPPPISLSILYEKNKKYIQKHAKNMQIHINMCKNVEKYMKKYKHVQEENLG